jgi:hypothetical protein
MLKEGIHTVDTAGHNGETTQQTEESARLVHGQTKAGREDFLASVIVPRAGSTRDITVLETAMQGLALDKRHPVALELAATSFSRRFLLRATTAMALKHLVDRVQASYLPMRSLRERELLQEGADPLLGILGVFNHLPFGLAWEDATPFVSSSVSTRNGRDHHTDCNLLPGFCCSAGQEPPGKYASV